MTKLKRVAAILLAMTFIVSFAACRKKNEVVLSFTDGTNTCDITAGLYMYNLMSAEIQFRNNVYNELSKSSDENTNLSNIDYQKQKYEDKDYTTWIKDEALKTCKTYAYSELKFEELGLSLDDSTSYIDSYCDYYWNNQGYSESFEQNGISFATYRKSVENTYKYGHVYDYYYGKKDDNNKDKGSLRPSDEEIKKAISENYAIADVIKYSFTDESGNSVSDSDKEKKLASLKSYAEKLNKGADFSKIYIEFNGSDKTVDSSSGSTAKDKYAEVYGNDKTSLNSDNYSDISGMKVGEAKVIETDSSYILALRQDISKDSYYFDTYADNAVSLLKQDEFDKSIEEAADKYDMTENKSALKFYSPKKIEYPTQKSAATTAAAY